MAEQPQKESGTHEYTKDEMQSALFAQLVMQQSNMALMLMGKVAHPQTGETMRDLESAQLFIGQLEMLETKTKGNLNKHEEALLKQTLMALRMAFVEAVEKPAPPEKIEKSAEAPQEKPAEAAAEAGAEKKTAPTESAGADAGTESRKRFSKKF